MKCAACDLPMTATYPGQTRHPLCHPCQRSNSECADCVAERRDHRRDKARTRHRQFTKRTEGDR